MSYESELVEGQPEADQIQASGSKGAESDETLNVENSERIKEETSDDKNGEMFKEESDENLIDETESLKKENEALLDNLLRLRADFDNFRKRVERDAAEISERMLVRFLEELLPVVDALDLAAAHEKEGDEDSSGIVKIANLLLELLEKYGVQKIGIKGEPFDPLKHEAVSHSDEKDDTFEGPVVDEVHRCGYMFKGKVIRPAAVSVKG
jgi:molecular chaperone GrpE